MNKRFLNTFVLRIFFVFISLYLTTNIHASVALKEASIIEAIRTESDLSKNRIKIRYLGEDIFLGKTKNYRQILYTQDYGQKRSGSITSFHKTIIIDKKGYVYALNIQDAKFESSKTISKLKKIRILKLRETESKKDGFFDVSGLWGLAKLRELDLYNNNIEKLNIPKRKYQLRYLNLGNNDIASFTGLANLKSLHFLDLKLNSKFNDVRVLAPLRQLKVLDLRKTPISSLEGIENLTTLIDLNLSSGEKLKSLKGIETLTKLKVLNLYNQPIEDITPLSKLINLNELTLTYAKINNLDALSKNVELRIIKISDTPIQSLIPLQKLVKLKVVSFKSVNLNSMEGVTELKNLEELILFKCNIPKILSLGKLTKLKLLDLRHNPITKITGL